MNDFLLDADGMDVPWEGSVTCDFNDDYFEDHNENDMPSASLELHLKHGALNNFDFFLLVATIFLLMKILQQAKTMTMMIPQ